MKEKILSLAQGKFRYQQPKLQLSLNRLILQVEEGGESSEQLVISNDEGTKVKGFGASEDIHFDFFPVFDGKENHVTVRVKAGNRKAGEVLTGVLYLVTDCGEQTLPYEVRIVKSYLKDSMGRSISGYPEFVRFAKENFEEAVRIFCHQKFLDRYLETLEDKRLYRHLTKKNSKKEALKEFLVTHGDMEKEPVPEEKTLEVPKTETVEIKKPAGKRFQKKKQWKRLITAHLHYIMNSSRRDQWIEALRACFPMDYALEGYLAYLKKDEDGKQKYLNLAAGVTEPEEGASMEQVLRYLITQYIKCKITKNELDKDEFYSEVRQYQSDGYQHIFCTVLLERMGYYQENVMGLWEDLNQLWSDGCYSPYLYLYQAMILLQEPDLLVRLDPQTVGICRFALRYDLLTENEVLAISFLAAKKKKETPAILSLLMGCYKKFHTTDTLHSICALLIRGEKQGPQYLKWFELGVKHHLRLPHGLRRKYHNTPDWNPSMHCVSAAKHHSRSFHFCGRPTYGRWHEGCPPGGQRPVPAPLRSYCRLHSEYQKAPSVFRLKRPKPIGHDRCKPVSAKRNPDFHPAAGKISYPLPRYSDSRHHRCPPIPVPLRRSRSVLLQIHPP